MLGANSSAEKLSGPYLDPQAPGSKASSGMAAQTTIDDQSRLFQLAHDAILVRDAYNRITFWNRAAERVYGWTQEEALGKGYYDLIQTQFPEPVARVRARLFKENHWEGEVLQTRRDGKEITIQSRLAVQRDFEERPVAVFEINHDITQRVNAEEKLRQITARLIQSQDEERRQIARELHDSAAQTLTALGINLAIIQSGVNGCLDSKLSKVLSDTSGLARQAGDEIRNLSHLLHPPDLETVGLLAAIRWYANAFEKRHGIHVDLDAPRQLTGLSEDVKIALFRMVQESLTNVHLHSGSKTARVRVAKEAGQITLEIQDKGKGMRAGSASRAGVGLSGMRERIRQLGGRLEVDSGPGGTMVRARLPVSSPGAAKRESLRR